MSEKQDNPSEQVDTRALWLEQVVGRFEDAYFRNENPAIEDYLLTEPGQRAIALNELVHVELECRLKDGQSARVEEYLARYPELQHDRYAVAELICTEYRLRCRREPDLTWQDWLARFPQYREELATRGTSELPTTAGRPLPTYYGRLPAAVASRDPITIGEVLGEYTVLEKIGEGGMGVVFKGEHRRMKRLVAIKMISPRLIQSPEAVKRFYREVQAAAKLSHPNIAQAHDASEYKGLHYLVMEYVDGKNLAAIVRENGPMEISQAVDYVLQAARGLQCAHEEGVVHRDIKPANLLVDKKGMVKIVDMSLASLANPDDGSQLTASGQVMGTCEYMAPEQALDTHHAGSRADIYSLGCTLYRLLTGQVPYHGDTFVQILRAHREAPLPSLRKVRPDVPPQLDAAFQKMVAKRPEDRQQTMTEVIADLMSAVAAD